MTKRQNLDIVQGQTFSYTYTHRDSAGSAIDLTGYTARMSIKVNLLSTGSAFLSTGADADGGTITLGGALGTVTLAMTAAETTALDQTDAFINAFLGDQQKLEQTIDFIYDLELVSSGGAVTRALEGFITFHRGVTQ